MLNFIWKDHKTAQYIRQIKDRRRVLFIFYISQNDFLIDPKNNKTLRIQTKNKTNFVL